MATEMGEYLVGAYLKLVRGFNVVDYNTRPPGGGLNGLGELDVIAFNFTSREVCLCEVTTHLDGLQIGPNADFTIRKISAKHQRQRSYAQSYLADFKPRYMFWSPRVRPQLAAKLESIEGLELYINDKYTAAVDELRVKASTSKADANNPAFRLLQILEHLRPRATTRKSANVPVEMTGAASYRHLT
jgi:Holliday junction resolvase-like predicted endonuclease